ncbi:hypothetical protein RISK_005586 [Rhodopirellula islandica]|uniref:Uncharacterized protein n=1 Tax=Rhodopirellula islandica TaxID=595434 RepID=A0A0J1B6S0_RHOIS|nr:hypothetical protein RISK_005586 [Rhodopirellula islandica]
MCISQFCGRLNYNPNNPSNHPEEFAIQAAENQAGTGPTIAKCQREDQSNREKTSRKVHGGGDCGEIAQMTQRDSFKPRRTELFV